VKVVIFCGGLGMRLREYSESIPKPMVPVGYRPILWHVMRYYAHFGHTDFILCLGYGAAAVKDYFLHYDETQSNDFTLTAGSRDIEMHRTDIHDWKISFIDTGLHSSIGERLMRVRALVENEDIFLANYADTLTDAPLDELVARFRRAPNAVASMLAVPPVSTHHLVDIDKIFSSEMSTAFRKFLIFNVTTGETSTLEFTNCPRYIFRSAKSRICIDNCRNVDGVSNVASELHHFGKSE